MSKAALRELVEQRWLALGTEAPPVEPRVHVAELPVVVKYGPVAVAVDHAGFRHLLVPMPGGAKTRTGIDGPVLQLRRRPLEDENSYQMYADLACLREDFGDLFSELCVDVLDALAVLPENPLKALHRVLDRWRALFRTDRTLLGPEQLAGLFAELTLLNRLLTQDPGAHRLWSGPLGHRHDFSASTLAVEVKAGQAGVARRPRIHGLDQLDPPANGALWLAWFGLRPTGFGGDGRSIVEMVDEARLLCDDDGAVLELLATVGYSIADGHRYKDVRFANDEERWYRVDAQFPRLTARQLSSAGVAVVVTDVGYTVDLSGASPMVLQPAEVDEVLDGLIRESA